MRHEVGESTPCVGIYSCWQTDMLRCAVLCCQLRWHSSQTALVTKESFALHAPVRLAPAPAGYIGFFSLFLPCIVCLAATCTNLTHPITATSQKSNQYLMKQCMLGCLCDVFVVFVVSFGVVRGGVWGCRHQPAVGSQQ